LIFGISLILVVLMASGVFAGLFGITGNALRTGERIAQDSSLTVKGIEDNKVRIGNDLYSEGQTFSDSGKIYEVRAIEKKAWFLGSDKVVVEPVDKPEPIGNKVYVGNSITFSVEDAIREFLSEEEISEEFGEALEDLSLRYVSLNIKGIYPNGRTTFELCGVDEYKEVECLEDYKSLALNDIYSWDDLIYIQIINLSYSEQWVVVEFWIDEEEYRKMFEGGEPIPIVFIEQEVTYEGVLKMLGGCEILGVDSKEEMDGDQACKSFGYSSCIFAQVRESSGRNLIRDCNDAPYLGNLEDGKDFLVMCCSP
ncbi:MAG: hypothetical protein KJ949_00910, partial [Nanoarchaeota archaeon]|nr:hypothetical protein [Nanoarchaeota archaeon]